MKPTLILAALCALIVTSCATLSRPPTPAEQEWFRVKTNELSVVTSRTNVVTITNEQAQVVWVTNVVLATNSIETYEYAPGEKAQAVVETGTAIGNLFGVGGIVGTGLGLLFGLYGSIRSSRSNKIASVLVQTIEAGRKVLASTPQGSQLEDAWVAWMSKNQTQTGVILEVAKLIKKVVNNETAQAVADQLIEMTKPPVQPPTA